MNPITWIANKRLPVGQQGFTLLETLVGLGIMITLSSALVGSLYQMNSTASRGSAHLQTEIDIRTSMQWLSKDARMANSIDLVDAGPAVSCATLAPNPCLSVQWTDEYASSSQAHSASYRLAGASLMRTHDGVTHTVARNVTDATFSLQGELVTATLVSTDDKWADISKQFTHYFYLRSLQ